MIKDTLKKAYYLGKKYPIYIHIKEDCKKSIITFEQDKLICMASKEDNIDYNKLIKSFYKKSGRKYIQGRLNYYQNHIKIKYKSMEIESLDKRWGSCNSKKHLTFHFKLMMLPKDIIDYVVVHELCHLIHMNHDRSYWRLVGKIYPDYKKAEKYLRGER